MNDSAKELKLHTKRFTNVDAMRGLAAILVIWIHFSEMWVKSHDNSSSNFLYVMPNVLGFGRIGVILFFCISGFVIPSSLYGSRVDGLRRFAVRRFFRLYPAYWVSIPLGLLTACYFGGRAIYPALVWGNITMVPEWLNIEMVLGVYWTLHIELFFYLMCAGIFAVGLLRNEASLIIVSLILHVIFLIGLGSHYLAKYFGLHLFDDFPLVIMTYASNLALMFWGTLLRSSFDGMALSKSGKIWLWFVPFLWIVILPSMGIFGRIALHNMNVEIIRFPLTVGAVIIIFLCGLKLPVISNRLVLYLGAISYSLYLFHLIVYALIWKCVSIYFGNLNLSLSIVLIFSCLLTIVFAGLVYRLVELPSQRIAKHIIQL